MHIIIIGHDHPERRKAEFLIRQVYFEKYGAILEKLPERLVGVVTPNGKIACLAGLRTAEEGFFSQYYLDEPVNDIATRLAGTPVPATAIVEVTGLVSRSPLCTGRFVLELVQLGVALGFQWALFTATARLGRLLRRRGLPLIRLGEASRERVPRAEQWGTYYDEAPEVFLLQGRVPDQHSYPATEGAGADV